ncbi:MAG: M20/M25/M40 family metallo-hydrolase [Myxococcales bacterium]|nr:M20/M25/M40 family metallo-hydrolase [Myxococcales bacterium]
MNHRNGSRLCAALLMAAACLLPPAQAAAVWPFGGGAPDPDEDPGRAAARILSRAIRIRTVNPPGDEKPLARMLMDVLEDADVEARLIDTPSAGSKPGRAAAWARVKGTGQRRPIVLLSHLDTVPADPRGWAIAPFEGATGAGSVVGRGALDAKGVAVVQLMATLAIARRDTPLKRDVIFLATPDEETGGRLGAGYLVRERRSLLYDAEYLLTEGGGVQVGEGGTSPVWGVTVTEKAPCWMDVIAEGTPGHSSIAPPDTAVTRLLDALARIRRFEPPIRVVPEVERMFAATAQLAPAENREGFRDLSTALESDGEFRRRFLAKPGRAALVRNTVAITVLSGSQQTNVIPGEARAQLDARLLPGEHCEDFVKLIEDVVRDSTIRVEPFLAFTTSSSPVNTGLYRAIERVAARLDPGASVVPRVIAGFTDAHYFRDLGITAYGFVPRWLPPSETRGIHGPNERISIENLGRGVETLVAILEELDASD